jgi:hypothetical protein
LVSDIKGRTQIEGVRFNVFTAVTMKDAVFWNMMMPKDSILHRLRVFENKVLRRIF